MKSVVELKNDLFRLGNDLNSDWYYLETKDKIGKKFDSYDSSTNTMILLVEVQGTQYEGRNTRIEDLLINDKVTIKREPNNEYNSLNLAVENKDNKSLGNLSADICDVLSPLIDKDIIIIDDASVEFVEPLSKRSAKCKKSLLTIKLILHFKEQIINSEHSSLICLLGGDQTRTWAQELSIIKCSIPLNEAKLLFEIYNRYCDEYNNDSLNYFGLDNLADEVIYARQKMKNEKITGLSYDRLYDADNLIDYMKIIIDKEAERYGQLKNYIPCDEEVYDDYYSLKDLIYANAIDENKYYWFDQCRVDKDEYEYHTGCEFNHWYEIVELYDPSQELPFDLSDEDIVSIFGFKKFESFGDLSYGC